MPLAECGPVDPPPKGALILSQHRREWPDTDRTLIEILRGFRGGEMHVSRSIWNGHVTAPKTRRGRTPVPVIRQPAARLEMHRLRCGNAQLGPIFPNNDASQ